MTPVGKRGARIKFLADCGHWTACYALEPTPTECRDCATLFPLSELPGQALLPEPPKRLKGTR